MCWQPIVALQNDANTCCRPFVGLQNVANTCCRPFAWLQNAADTCCHPFAGLRSVADTCWLVPPRADNRKGKIFLPKFHMLHGKNFISS